MDLCVLNKNSVSIKVMPISFMQSLEFRIIDSFFQKQVFLLLMTSLFFLDVEVHLRAMRYKDTVH